MATLSLPYVALTYRVSFHTDVTYLFISMHPIIAQEHVEASKYRDGMINQLQDRLSMSEEAMEILHENSK